MKIILILFLLLLILFCLMLQGRKNHPKLALLRQYRFAHRGYHNKPQIPENSLAAFQRAIDHGWGAELDVHLLKDGTLAVFHDSDLKRCTGQSGMIEDLTKDDLALLRLEGTQEHVPLFDEVLALFEHKAPLIIELKTARGNHWALAKAVCERLDHYSGDFCIESFDPFAVLAVKRLRPQICRGQLSMSFFKNPNNLSLYKRIAATNLLCNFLARPDFIAYKFEDRANFCLQLCLKLWRLQHVSWTICKHEDLLRAESENAIAIFEQFDPDCA